MPGMIKVSSFYKFFNITALELEQKRSELLSLAKTLKVNGLLIIALEGLNGTMSGSEAAISAFEEELSRVFGIKDWIFKNSYCTKKPFRDFRVKIREEIVSTRSKDQVLVKDNNEHLSPEEWQDILENEKDFILIDTRNWYETALGAFQGALDPQIKHFSEFPAAVEKLNIPKDKKVLMYCTGGIRCEKAAVQMQDLGYSKVFQLAGGILNYLQKFPDNKFHGECFVFDSRVSVDQKMEASQIWVLCPHCGQPGKEEIACLLCSKEVKVCKQCLAKEENRTCSHNCSHHYLLKKERAQQNRANL